MRGLRIVYTEREVIYIACGGCYSMWIHKSFSPKAREALFLLPGSD
jgi:hypothetical protein